MRYGDVYVSAGGDIVMIVRRDLGWAQALILVSGQFFRAGGWEFDGPLVWITLLGLGGSEWSITH